MAYMGGSAYAMANSMMEGYTIPSPTNLKRLTTEELRELQFEVEKLLRDQRSIVPDQQDTMALNKRNQKIGKLTQAQIALNHFMTLRLRGRA